MESRSRQIKEYKLPTDGKQGILIQPLPNKGEASHDTIKPHRDNHYQLLFAWEGDYHLRIDFEELNIRAPFVLQIKPGQVHQTIKTIHARGWVMGIEASFLENEFKNFLDNNDYQIIQIKKDQSAFQQTTHIILEQAYLLQTNHNNVFTSRAIFHLANSLFCLFINEVSNSTTIKGGVTREKRAYVIEQAFKALLNNHYKEWKRPALYAVELSMTTAHLNDTVKEVTGKSVTTHVQERCMLEAKRLLYFTDLEVKEIAFQIGFENPVYFGKLFRKLAAETPLGFRHKFRD